MGTDKLTEEETEVPLATSEVLLAWIPIGADFVVEDVPDVELTVEAINDEAHNVQVDIVVLELTD